VVRRLDIPAAAAALGLSETAVRRRLQRRGLAGGKDEAGRWYVELADGDTGRDTDGVPSVDRGTPGGIPPASAGDTALYERLIEGKDAELARLADELERTHAALRRAQEAEGEQRRIIAGLMARLPELAAPTPRPDATAGPPAEAVPPPVAEVPGPRKPWWRFW